MANLDQRRLVNGLRSGKAEAYAELVHDHYQAVYRFLLHMARDTHRAEDLTQDTFATAWERIGTFRGQSSLATWLHRIAYTKFIDGQRAARRIAALNESPTNGPAAPAGPLESAMAEDESRRLYRALNALAPEGRTVLVLHYLQGFSYREMATVLDEPSGTVKWRTSQALNSLRILLAEEVKDHAPRTTVKLRPIA